MTGGKIVTAQLPDLGVTTAKIAANAVTQAKLDSALSGVTICTSSTKPVSPFTGQTIFETDTNKMKVWLGSVWSSGFTHTDTLFVEYLVVAGGGGGGGSNANNGGAGGAGAGGYRTGTLSLTIGTTSTVTVGGGGTGGANTGASGAAGSDSVFGSITSTGGGFGGGRMPSSNGGAGGSGGGGGGDYLGATRTGGAGNTPSVSPSQGNNGGNGFDGANSSGGGGGGAGGVGGNAAGNTRGLAGAGTANLITGSSVTYAVGGVGAQPNDGNGVAGTANRGNGGAAGGATASAVTGGAGGSGVVICKYLTADASGLTITGGTATTSGSYTVRTFTASGSLVIA
jgi:hypothetical protein